ncbi:hypothetical protein ACFL3T_00750 [Patescibacteria group bacterium]
MALENLSKQEMDKLLKERPGRWTEALLKKSIVVTTQEDDVLEGEIVTAVAFSHNEPGKQDDKRFKEKERKVGEVIIYDRYGNPMLGVVVNGDEDKQETVWLKEFRVRQEGGSPKGKKVSFGKFLTEAGLDPKDLAQVLEDFDGVQAWDPDDDSTLHITDPVIGVQSQRQAIQRKVGSVTAECLGEFHKGK